MLCSNGMIRQCHTKQRPHGKLVERGAGTRTICSSAVTVLERAGGIDLIDGPAQLQQLPARPALDAMPPARSLQGGHSRLRPKSTVYRSDA